MSYNPKSTKITWEADGVVQDGVKIPFKNVNQTRPKYFNNILEANGRTPLTKLHKIPQALGIKCNIYAKLEYFNIGGSTEDRAALRIIENAEANGLNKDHTIISPSSGNMAVALAVICAIKEHKLVIVSTELGTREVDSVLTTLGAKVIRTNNDNTWDSVDSHFAVALALSKGVEKPFWVDANVDACSAIAHYETTAKEIDQALSGKVDAVIVPVNTGALLSGVSKYFKNNGRTTKVYGVRGEEKPLTYAHDIPELSLPFETSVSDFSDVAEIQTIDSREVFLMTRRLIREEGVMVGASSGAALVVALKEAKSLPEGANVVMIMPDGIRNYLNHFLDDEWLIKHKIIKESDREVIKPKEVYDPSVLVYTPTTLAGKWENDAENKWSNCENPFKPFRSERPAILETAIEAIGNTPLVKLQKLPKIYGIECNVFVKCEYMNAGGSTKDRIAWRMIELAEQQGKLKKGMTIIEPTSGNTGIGLALAAAVKGYRCVIVMPVKMSREKALAMEALGSIIVRTPNHSYDSPDSNIGVALRLSKEIPDSIILDQYRNLGNPMAHFESTAEEVIQDLDGKVDYMVVGTGTGGTISGIARKMNAKVPSCKVVGVDPEGSILADPTDPGAGGFYEVEGVGYDFIPGVLERSVVDIWKKTNDNQAFVIARALISKEGILCGGSSGANVHAALEVARGLPADKNVVAILPDGVRNYLSKFLSPEWMKERHYDFETTGNI